MISSEQINVPEQFPILGNTLSIGRGRDCDLVIPNIAISRKHCTFEKTVDDKWFIYDSSSNGILLNGHPVIKLTKTELPHGSYITFTDHIYYKFENVPENPDDVASPMKVMLKRVLHPVEMDETIINLCDDSMVQVVHPDNDVQILESNRAATACNKTCSNTTALSSNNTAAMTSGNASAMSSNNSVVTDNAAVPMIVNPAGDKPSGDNGLDTMKEELTCAICSEIFINALVLDCKHTFCSYCIGMWRKTQNVCPVCRSPIGQEPTPCLVIDNCCNTVISMMSQAEKDQREETIKNRVTEMEKSKAKKTKAKGGRSRGRGRGRGRGRQSMSSRPNSRHNNMVVSIEISSSSDTDLDDEDFHEFAMEMDNIEDIIYGTYLDGYTGIPGRYYGGYGRCYICQQQGHWSNGCPNRPNRPPATNVVNEYDA